jgi:hypothetical protein
MDAFHAATDDSFRESAGLACIITADDIRAGRAMALVAEALGFRRTAFDVEAAAIRDAIKWVRTCPYQH